jgi:peptidoglycan hydrolase-like protein with peptidoglycan-binding domain
MSSAWRRLKRASIRGTILVALVAVSSVMVPTAESYANEFAPADEPYLAYSSGLEPGSVLAGQVLPIDWSERESPCETGAERPRLDYRVGPSATPPLCPGDAHEAVAHLQELLTEKKLYREEITGVYDRETRYAVAAFHKVLGPSHSDPRTARDEWIADPPPEDWTAEDWELLAAFDPKPPRYREGQPDRVEIDIGHQVMYLIVGDEVDAIFPISTGQGRGLIGCTRLDSGCYANVTPRTDRLEAGSSFYYQHNYGGGWSPLPGDWSIYKGIFYRGNYGEWNYGIHGYRDVPHHPESHGCIRTTTWDMDYLRPDDGSSQWGSYINNSRVTLGMTVHVWDA